MFMSKARLFTFCLLTITLAATGNAQRPATVELPAGYMQNKARTACTTCHDAHIIVQQRLSNDAWGKEVDKMMKWGAIVNPSDRDALVEYFSQNLTPDKPAYVAQRSARRMH
jgi:hypothetical protein